MADRAPAVKTSRRECGSCRTRILIIRGVPPLNYGRDPAGDVAVTLSDPRRGRFLARGEQPGPLEHRYSVHTCDATAHAAQRGEWAQATSRHHRAQRRQRGSRRQAAMLPGMARVYPGRQP